MKAYFNSTAFLILRYSVSSNYFKDRNLEDLSKMDENDVKNILIGSQAVYSNIFLTRDEVQKTTFEEMSEPYRIQLRSGWTITKK